MTFNANWDVDKYKEEHESEDQWQLRKAFMDKWKNKYSEERLVCLARVFTNIEFLGCRYPTEVMQEVDRLAGDIPNEYRNKQKTKLQRTFVSASEAARYYVRRTIPKNTGTKLAPKCTKKVIKPQKIAFVPQHQDKKSTGTLNNKLVKDLEEIRSKLQMKRSRAQRIKSEKAAMLERENNVKLQDLKLFYTNQMAEVKCVNSREFNEKMFDTEYGKFVLVITPWIDIPSIVMNSFTNCELTVKQNYKERKFTVTVNGKVVASAEGSRKEARDTVYNSMWNHLRHNTVSLMLKEEWIPQNDTRISMSDLTKKNEYETPCDDSVAWKIMKLMGWKGGGLGADSQGITEPIELNLKMISRSGLGHKVDKLSALRRAGLALMKRHSECQDGDLVFTTEFTNQERAVLHQCAQECDLVSQSYGKKGKNRFLVVSNQLDPFTTVRVVTQQGGETPKYQVFIPEVLAGIK